MENCRTKPLELNLLRRHWVAPQKALCACRCRYVPSGGICPPHRQVTTTALLKTNPPPTPFQETRLAMPVRQSTLLLKYRPILCQLDLSSFRILEETFRHRTFWKTWLRCADARPCAHGHFWGAWDEGLGFRVSLLVVRRE